MLRAPPGASTHPDDAREHQKVGLGLSYQPCAACDEKSLRRGAAEPIRGSLASCRRYDREAPFRCSNTPPSLRVCAATPVLPLFSPAHARHSRLATTWQQGEDSLKSNGRSFRSTGLLGWLGWAIWSVNSLSWSPGARPARFARIRPPCLSMRLMPLLRAPPEPAPCMADSLSTSRSSPLVQRRVPAQWCTTRATSGAAGSAPSATLAASSSAEARRGAALHAAAVVPSWRG